MCLTIRLSHPVIRNVYCGTVLEEETLLLLASGLKRNGGLSLQVQNRARPFAAHSPLGATWTMTLCCCARHDGCNSDRHSSDVMHSVLPWLVRCRVCHPTRFTVNPFGPSTGCVLVFTISTFKIYIYISHYYTCQVPKLFQSMSKGARMMKRRSIFYMAYLIETPWLRQHRWTYTVEFARVSTHWTFVLYWRSHSCIALFDSICQAVCVLPPPLQHTGILSTATHIPSPIRWKKVNRHLALDVSSKG